MFSEVMEFFGLERELDHLGFFETASQKHLEKELKITIAQGRLIAISGIVGSGKTTFLQRLMADLTKSKQIITQSIARLLNVRPAEVRSFLHGQLPPEKTQDMRDLILKIGIPL